MPSHESRPSKSRRHIAIACRSCRNDKIKCDGTTPICRQCATKGRECTYAEIDWRKLSLRKTVEIYLDRVRQLESFIASHGLAVPPPNPENATMLDQLSLLYAPLRQSKSPAAQAKSHEMSSEKAPGSTTAEVLHLAQTTDSPQEADDAQAFGVPNPHEWMDSHVHDGLIAGISMDLSGFQDVNETTLPLNGGFDVDWVWNHSIPPQGTGNLDIGDLGFPPQKTTDPILQMTAEVEYDSLEPSPVTPWTDEGSTDDEDHSEVTNQLSARLGSLLESENGEHHFYGATSNFNIVRGNVTSVLYSKPYGRTKQAEARLKTAGIDQPVSEDLENHLLELFFTWHNSSLYTVDRKLFNEARETFKAGNKETPFYSTFLLNAMCAVRALFETRRYPNLPSPLSELFASRATTLLDFELEHPRIATVQALAVLSNHEAAYTRDTQGWLFSGMAIRLAIDFGLHSGVKTYIEDVSMSIVEARGRSVGFWGAFATDRMRGLYLGRPFHNILQAATVETPMPFSGQDETYWLLCASASENATADKARAVQELLVERWIQLSRIMSTLEGSLYFRSDASNTELQKLGQLTWQRLLTWRQNLPPELDLDLDGPMPVDCPPQVLILHMIFEHLAIVLHRPFVAKNYIQPIPRVGRGAQHARDMCVGAVSRTATLLSWYEQRHSVSRASVQVVQAAFGAALILVYATVSGGDPDAHHRLSGHLDVCCRALAEMGAVLGCATRALDVLLRIKRAWQARLVAAAAGSKRRASSASLRPERRGRV